MSGACLRKINLPTKNVASPKPALNSASFADHSSNRATRDDHQIPTPSHHSKCASRSGQAVCSTQAK